MAKSASGASRMKAGPARKAAPRSGAAGGPGARPAATPAGGETFRTLTGDALRRDLAKRPAGDLFARVFSIWEGLPPGGWSDERFFALDGEVLSRLFLVGVERAPARYRYRFVGTELCDLHGQDYAGVYLHEMRLGEVGDAVAAAFDRVVAERAPLLVRGGFVTPDGAVGAERLLLPLSRDGRGCDTILGALARSAPAGPDAPARRAPGG